MHELNFEGARLAREAADEWTARTPDKPRFVAGAIGPTNRMLSLSPDVEDPAARAITFDELRGGLRRAGARPDRRRRRPAAGGDDHRRRSTPRPRSLPSRTWPRRPASACPLMISVTITDRSGRTLAGQTIEAFWITSRTRGPSASASTARWAPPTCGPTSTTSRASPRAGPAATPTRACPTPSASTTRAPDETAGELREFAAIGLRQHPRRLLRHHPGPHPRHRRGRGRRVAPRDPGAGAAHPPARASRRWWCGPTRTS